MNRRSTAPPDSSPGRALGKRTDAPDRKKSLVREYLEPVLAILLIALVIRTFVVHAYRIPSGSMEDTLLIGDYLLANRFIYGSPIEIPFTGIVLGRLPAISGPQRGDVVIFASWTDTSEDFIKRCVGLPGDTIVVRNNVLTVNGRVFDEVLRERFGDEPSVFPKIKYTPTRYLSTYGFGSVDPGNYGPHIVPPGHLFVMGDNRNNSADSRFHGDVPLSRLKARAMIIYWSMDTSRPIWDLAEFVRWRRIGRLIR